MSPIRPRSLAPPVEGAGMRSWLARNGSFVHLARAPGTLRYGAKAVETEFVYYAPNP